MNVQQPLSCYTIQRNKVEDQSLLEAVFRYLVGNVGNIVCSKKISDYMNSQNRKNATVDQIEQYLKMLTKTFILYRCDRYDLAGKELMAAPGKYYLVDTGFRNILLSGKKTDYGHLIENVVIKY